VTVTPTRSGSATPSLTPTGTSTATPTGTAAPACVGDCDGNRRVTVDELVLGVNISLERQSLDLCRPFDPSLNGKVEVNELIQGVNNSLGACPGS
jgi:hypothetical protein